MKECTGFLVNKILQTIFIVLLIHTPLNAQNRVLNLDVYQTPLNNVLLKLSDKYNIQLSYNDSELAEFLVSHQEKFKSVNDLLNKLLQPYPFDFEQQGDVYVIFKIDEKLTINLF